MRPLAIVAAAGAALSLLSIFLVDGPVAISLSATSPAFVHAVRTTTRVYELVFAYPLSPYLYGALAIGLGVAGLVRERRGALWRALVFVGAGHVTSRFAVSVLKTVFARPRPFEALGEDGILHDAFFTSGSSFPSGHAAHGWGLYFPIAFLFPRARVPLLVVPVFISFARVAVNDHYVADTLASMSVSALVTLGYASLLHADPRSEP